MPWTKSPFSVIRLGGEIFRDSKLIPSAGIFTDQVVVPLSSDCGRKMLSRPYLQKRWSMPPNEVQSFHIRSTSYDVTLTRLPCSLPSQRRRKALMLDELVDVCNGMDQRMT